MQPDILLWAAAIAVVIQRAAELRLARSNEAWARARGAVEHGAGHYPAFFLLHGAWLVGWVGEAWARGPALSSGWWVWLAALGLAEALRYWAIATLGRRWNTRVLVVPGEAPVRGGPYRFVRHPNYVAVALELAAVPMLFGAWITTLITGLANAILLLGVRIPIEERALARAAAGSTLERRPGSEEHQ